MTLSPLRERWLLVVLAGVQFTHIVDFMVMMPLGPQFTTLFGISDAQFGLLVSAYTLAAGVSGLAASAYIDRIGRKRALLTLYSLFALATLACGLAPDYASLMVARVAAGAFGGVLSALAHTIVADVVPFARRARAVSVVMMAFSLATVAGVPLSLFAAAQFGWHAPFIGLAVISAVIAGVAALVLPPLAGHVNAQPPSLLRGMAQVLAERNHQKAFAFTALLMFTSFPIIPYITIYMQANVGVKATEIPLIYLCGGTVTLLSARWIGAWSDRVGKVYAFRRLSLAACVPMMTVTLLGPVPLLLVILNSSLFFLFTSGRSIPGLAILTAAANPSARGAFMSLNGAWQSIAMGAAAFVGGALISRDAQGLVQGYWMAGIVSLMAALITFWLVGRLYLHTTTPTEAATNAELTPKPPDF